MPLLCCHLSFNNTSLTIIITLFEETVTPTVHMVYYKPYTTLNVACARATVAYANRGIYPLILLL